MQQSPLDQALGTIPRQPVYRDQHVALFHARCEDILPRVEPSKSVTIVTDPPYGIKWCNSASRIPRPILGDDRPFDPSHLLRFRCVLFGAMHYCQRLPVGGSCLIIFLRLDA